MLRAVSFWFVRSGWDPVFEISKKFPSDAVDRKPSLRTTAGDHHFSPLPREAVAHPSQVDRLVQRQTWSCVLNIPSDSPLAFSWWHLLSPSFITHSPLSSVEGTLLLLSAFMVLGSAPISIQKFPFHILTHWICFSSFASIKDVRKRPLLLFYYFQITLICWCTSVGISLIFITNVACRSTLLSK